ncbi:hypothetical protein [Phyllobacterium bourgognense]|uniref:hypothetical protein n=1 Tax=Phyllobacterium bourgognense TaxID=314236 RepID=UPI001FE1F60C|nr:hypothetical protein [Phyllobacterium bourgognense]
MKTYLYKVATLAAALTCCATVAAYADDDSVNSAYYLCAVMDKTGLASAPCEVSGWNSSVTATIDMNSDEARDLCGKIAGMMRDKGKAFRSGWTFQIKSPFSGQNSIAYCNL